MISAMEKEIESRLVRLCIEAACESKEAVEKWRRQRRTLERMPSPLADALLRHLLRRRLLFPSLLEVFKHCVEVVDLRGENGIDAEWMAYLGAFRYLRSLNLADCRRINSSALWALTGMSGLKEVDLSRCGKVTDAAIKHLVSIPSLEILRISGTGVTADGVMLVSSLKNLTVLDLGDLPVTDRALSFLQGLSNLEYLDLGGSQISNKGATFLQMFPRLSFLNLGWTGVTRLPNISSLECLDLSNCTINSIFEGDCNKVALSKIMFSGTIFVNEAEAFLYMETSSLSYLDVSSSSLHGFSFLPCMKSLEYLDLSSGTIGDDSLEAVAHIGANLRHLNLSKTRITSAGIAILAGHVPRLAYLSLSYTLIDDLALSYVSMMPTLKNVDLSNTSIKGFIHQVDAQSNLICSLTALHSLNGLETLNLDHTQLTDAALEPLISMQELSHLSLKSSSLTDAFLFQLSSLSKLTNLGIGDAVLTNNGLLLFKPPATLKMLDLRGCWLLTKDVISLFCKKHPSIDVRHELFGVSPDQNTSNHLSPPKISLRASQVNRKHGKIPVSHPISPYFSDQRLKYGREELLALQYQSLSLRSPCDADFGISERQSN